MSLIGLAFWPGVAQVVSCRYTRGLGTAPGHAILEFLPQQGNIAAQGTLTFTFGSNFVNLFRCRVDFGSMRWSPTSGQTVVVKIMDRRWTWQAGGRILGRYNITRSDGSIEPGSERTPQQLASFLLNEMGESGYDVSALPNGVRPFVDWQWSHPATELDRLCEELGCRVCLKIASDRVVIVRPGFGNLLPTANLQTITQNVDLAEVPDALELVGDLARFQSKLKLQAVGQEKNGTIKPIDDLTYTPSGGWGLDPMFNDVSDTEERELARKWVFKAYQAVSQADGSQEIPYFGDVEKIKNILPIDPYLVETYTDQNSVVRFRPAFVEGVWYQADPQWGPLVGDNTQAGTRYNGEFSIDREDGIVRFQEPVYKLDSLVVPVGAELYLTCSYHAVEPNSQVPLRFVLNRSLGGNNGTGPRVVARNDIRFTARQEYTNNTQPSGEVTNLAQCTQEGNNQLDATQLEYGGSVAFYAIYNGIMPIDIDGLTRQVTFKVDSQDTSFQGGAETYASVNSEADPYVPRYNQRKVSREAVRERTRISRRQRFPNP